MGRKRQDREPSPDIPPICQRMSWLLTHVWGNNMTRMARDLGVSQTAVSRVLGGQVPSGKMLEFLIVTAGVNLRWLLTGQGQETLGRVGAVGGAFWPVVANLLPGQPSEHPELLSHLTLPAASPFVLESAYWHQVTAGMPVASDRVIGATAGDYLLLETAARWTRRPEAYLGRMVALRLPDDGGVILARSGRDRLEMEETVEHDLDTFGVIEEARLLPRIMRDAARRERAKTTGAKRGLVRFFADDVVGVVLQRTNFLDRL